jgi:hypothetical protein
VHLATASDIASSSGCRERSLQVFENLRFSPCRFRSSLVPRIGRLPLSLRGDRQDRVGRGQVFHLLTKVRKTLHSPSVVSKK